MPAHDLQLVRDPISMPARQGSAVILACTEQGFLLDLLDPRAAGLTAKRAASCLLEPAVGDRVWYAVESEMTCGWVIAVLEREASETPTSLVIEGNAEFRTRAGKLTFTGEQGIELRTDARLDVRADEVKVHARLGRVLLDEGSMILRSLFTHASKSTLVGKVIETLAERITTHSQTSLRTVDELDQTRAGSIDYRAQTTAQIGAEHAFLTGGELVKVDGGQIHLG